MFGFPLGVLGSRRSNLGKWWNTLRILWVVGVIAKSHIDMSKKLWDLWGTNLSVIVLEGKTCNCGSSEGEN